MGVCVLNFRSVSFFVWPGDVTEIHKYTSEFKNIPRPAAHLTWILITSRSIIIYKSNLTDTPVSNHKIKREFGN